MKSKAQKTAANRQLKAWVQLKRAELAAQIVGARAQLTRQIAEKRKSLHKGTSIAAGPKKRKVHAKKPPRPAPHTARAPVVKKKKKKARGRAKRGR